jgi:hypothetical protein
MLLAPRVAPRPGTMIHGPGALARSVLLAGLPPDAAEAAVQRSVAAIASSSPEEVFLFKLPSGLCLGHGLVRLADAADAGALLSGDLTVSRRGGGALPRRLLSWPLQPGA